MSRRDQPTPPDRGGDQPTAAAVEPTQPAARPDPAPRSAATRAVVADDGGRFDPISALLRSWALLLVCALLGAGLLAAAASVRPVVYTSEAKVLFQSDVSQFLPAGTVGAGAGDADRALSTQADVIVGDTVMAAAAQGLAVDVDDLRDRTLIEVRASSDVIGVQVTNTDAAQAQREAQTLVDSYLTGNQVQGRAALTSQADALQPSIDTLQQQLDALNAQVPPVAVTPAQIANANAAAAATAASRDAVIGRLSDLTTQQDQLRAAATIYPGQVRVLAGADLPTEPSSLSRPVAIALGAALGLVLGILLALLLAARRAARPAATAV
ncbi:hypothetical protein [Modestobacter sp. SSW1-42]|uniref:hypothetical protein n=1 Tax=Modestobacter sp. SSW1-42 TaxID=596372 RepID=UPI00398719F2